MNIFKLIKGLKKAGKLSLSEMVEGEEIIEGNGSYTVPVVPMFAPGTPLYFARAGNHPAPVRTMNKRQRRKLNRQTQNFK